MIGEIVTGRKAWGIDQEIDMDLSEAVQYYANIEFADRVNCDA
jgi:hypothetical protein